MRSSRNAGRFVVVGTKEPALARAVAEGLTAAKIEHLTLSTFRARQEFLDLLAGSLVAVCLPRAEEGFYLPALEAMGLGCLVVTLDCVGNRGFCRHEENCLIAERTAESIIAAAARALRLPAEQSERLLGRAAVTAREHTLDVERTRFHALLAEIDRTWASG